MLVWICATFLTILVTYIALLSLQRGEGAFSVGIEETSFYNKQMQEIAADFNRGLIDEDSAQEARLELARQLLAAKKVASISTQPPIYHPFRRFIVTVVLLFIPIFSWGLYAFLGNSEVKSRPFQVLMDRNPASLSGAEQLVQLEALFARNRRDGHLADELAVAYLTAGRFQDAANSYLAALRINGESAPRLVGYGMAITNYEGGVVTKTAQDAFAEAARIAPNDYYPHLFLAQALEQGGKRQEAIAVLEQFLAHTALSQDSKIMAARVNAQAVIERLEQGLPKKSFAQPKKED